MGQRAQASAHYGPFGAQAWAHHGPIGPSFGPPWGGPSLGPSWAQPNLRPIMAHGPWGAQAWAHHGPYVRYLIECNHTHDKISDWRGGPKASPQFAEGAIQVDPWRTLTAGIRARSLDELQTPNRSTRRRIRLPLLKARLRELQYYSHLR